jgi:natural product precursor
VIGSRAISSFADVEEEEWTMKKQLVMKKLKLSRESLIELREPQLRNLIGGSFSCDSCFPDICQPRDTSACAR